MAEVGLVAGYCRRCTLSGEPARIGEVLMIGIHKRSAQTLSAALLCLGSISFEVAPEVAPDSDPGGKRVAYVSVDDIVVLAVACTVVTPGISNRVRSTSLSVVSAGGPALYDAALDHNIDGGTNGTSVTVRRR